MNLIIEIMCRADKDKTQLYIDKAEGIEVMATIIGYRLAVDVDRTRVFFMKDERIYLTLIVAGDMMYMNYGYLNKGARQKSKELGLLKGRPYDWEIVLDSLVKLI